MFRRPLMFRKQLLRDSRAVSQYLTGSSSIQRAHLSQRAYPTIPRSVRLTALPSQRLERRWQSSDAEKPSDAPAEAEAKPAESAEDAAKVELEKKNKEIIDLKDKYLRSVADYRNLQDRSKRDQDNARQFAIQRFAADLLDSIDNLDRALVSVPKEAVGEPDSSTTSNTSSADPNKAASSESVTPNPDLVNLYSGLKMTNEIMLNTLKKHGLERFDPLEREGRKFNPQTDEATFFTKVEGKADGEVFYTQSKGFTLNGRVVRAAKVGVVKNS